MAIFTFFEIDIRDKLFQLFREFIESVEIFHKSGADIFINEVGINEKDVEDFFDFSLIDFLVEESVDRDNKNKSEFIDMMGMVFNN